MFIRAKIKVLFYEYYISILNIVTEYVCKKIPFIIFLNGCDFSAILGCDIYFTVSSFFNIGDNINDSIFLRKPSANSYTHLRVLHE